MTHHQQQQQQQQQQRLIYSYDLLSPRGYLILLISIPLYWYSNVHAVVYVRE